MGFPQDYDWVRQQSQFQKVSRAELNAALESYARKPANTVALIGASITWWNGPGGIYDESPSLRQSHVQGFWTWANIALGGRLKLLRTAGVGGERSDQILARITDVTDLPETPGYVVLLDCASNDVLQAIPSATTIANLDAIYTALQDKGITVVACTIPPIWSATPAVWVTQSEVNAWIIERAKDPGIILADVTGRWADATAGGARTGLTTDGAHPTTVGAIALGKVIADAMRPYIGGSVALPYQNADTTDVLTNGMLVGTAGVIQGGAGTGQLADSWAWTKISGAGSAALSKVARTDDIAGSWQQITLGSGGGSFYLYQNATIPGIAPGHEYVAEFEFDAANFSGFTKFALQIATLGGSAYSTAMDQLAGQSLVGSAEIASGVVRTPQFTVAGLGATGLQALFLIEGTTGTIRIGRIRLRRVA